MKPWVVKLAVWVSKVYHKYYFSSIHWSIRIYGKNLKVWLTPKEMINFEDSGVYSNNEGYLKELSKAIAKNITFIHKFWQCWKPYLFFAQKTPEK